jgi:histidinol-phosphate aminotransferase
MSKYWSAVTRGLTPYVPGEQPKLSKLVKLNTNENPYPPSPRAVAAMQAELASDGEANGANLRLYPDPNADRVKSAIAHHFAAEGITPAHVFVGNGSDEVLAHAFQGPAQARAPDPLPGHHLQFLPGVLRAVWR